MAERTVTNWIAWLDTRRHYAVNYMLAYILVVGTAGLLTSYITALSGAGFSGNLIPYTLTYLAILSLFLVRRMPDRWRVVSLIHLLFLFGIFSFISGWLVSSGRIFLLTMIVVSAIFVGPRAGLVAASFALAAYAVFAFAFGLDWLNLRPLPDPTTAPPMIIEGVGYLIAVGIVIISQWFFSQALQAASRANQEAQNVREQLAEANLQLAVSEASFANIVQRSSDGIIVVDQAGTVQFTNQTAQTYFQRNRGEFIGKPSPFPINADQILELEISTTPTDKGYAELRVVSTEWNGKPAHLALLRDITDRKIAEQEREKLIAELETKNAELERFTYTVSHDLKSPIVTIRGFLGYLEKSMLAGNHEMMRSDMARIVQATNRMQQLLHELLDLSRVGRMMNPPVDVSFNAIAHQAGENTRGRLMEKRITLHIADNLPTVHGDQARLVEVVQNLIDNAAKFMGDQPNPHIEIGTLGGAADGKPIFFVRDNGIGIDPQFHDKVFGLFNKLDAKSEGTGVGLALVKRIIEFHGGRIWVESEGAGKGSQFCFTLPKAVSK